MHLVEGRFRCVVGQLSLILGWEQEALCVLASEGPDIVVGLLTEGLQVPVGPGEGGGDSGQTQRSEVDG